MTAPAKQQFRIVASTNCARSFVVFVDAADETGARLFFAQAFPGSTVASIRLEVADPCAAYERKAGL